MNTRTMKGTIFALVCLCTLFSLWHHPVGGVMLGPDTTNETLVGTNMTVSFPKLPNLLFTFRRLNGDILPGVNMSYFWVSFDEIDNSTGTAVEGGIPVVVKSLDLQSSSLVWTEQIAYPLDSNGNKYKNLNYSTTFPTGEVVTFSYYYFPNPFHIDYTYVNSSRTIPADSFKLSIQINGWKPVNKSNLFLIRLHDNAIPFFTHVVNSNEGLTYSVVIDVGDATVTQYLNLLAVAVLDGIPEYLNWYGEYVGLTLVPEIRIAGFHLYFYFPNYFTDLFYDPDLSVLVLDQGSSDSGGSGDGGSDTQTILIAVLVPTLIGGAILLIVAVIVVTMVLMRKKIAAMRFKLKKVSSVAAADEEADQAS